MSTGRFCEKHEEWCPNGECRWCVGPVAGRQAPREPLRFDEWTPGEPVTLDGRPLNSAFWDGGQQTHPQDPFTIAAEAVQEVAREAGLRMDIHQARYGAEWQIWASNIPSCVAVVQTISRLEVLQNNTPTRIRALVRSRAEACVRRLREPAQKGPARTATEVLPE